jgi:4-methoxybenzoate monooxygenase (O-demethylating)
MTRVAEQRRLIEAPVLDIDPNAIGVLGNPYPFHEELRDTGPVARIKAHGVYAVGRHAEAAEVLNVK